MTDIFKFLDTSNPPYLENALVGRVPAGIDDTHALLRGVADALFFPAYFGANWNALYDCLRDFHWIDKRSVVIVHNDLPNIPSADLKVYLEVLRDAANDWKIDEPHELVIVFDASCRGAVAEALRG